MNLANVLGLRTGAIVVCAFAILPLACSRNVQWSGRAHRRILVKIAPRDLKGRPLARMPARLEMEAQIDPASLEVVRYDPDTGRPYPGRVNFRFDASAPTLFMSHYWPDDGESGGTLVWTHEQHGDVASYYAIYYDTWHPGSGIAPRDWIGDGDIEYVARAPFPQVLLLRPFGFDWDGDGKIDVIVGDELGYVTLYRNQGTPSTPKFGLGEPLKADGKPVKVEWSAAPVVVDWNGDGLPDLLVAQEPQGVIHFYQNIGTRQKPVLTDRGLLQADGAILKPPYLPVPEMPTGIFGDKYGSVVDAVDWDGDGKLSLLVGTYITGEIYLYRNIGTNADGTRRLHSEGPLQADGKDLDVIWNSTPSAADLNGDGKLELISGSFGMSPSGGDRPQDSRLHLYERRGRSLHEVPFPFDEGESSALQKLAASGGAPFSTALADLNGDGLIDLLVGTGAGTVIYFQNTGTHTSPRFHFVKALEGDWVPHRWSFDSIVDFYGDGKPVLLEGGEGTHAMISQGPRFNIWSELKTTTGKSFGKAAAHGDDFGNAQLYDFDGDGKPDLIFGTVDGEVLIYRNTGTRQQPKFADAEIARMADGTPLVAGFPSDSKVTNFTLLQGNRAIPAAADFNGDGKTDLVVGDTMGEVLYYENVTDNAHPRFASPRKLISRSGRIFLNTTDWDGDGLPDLIVASSGGTSGKQIVLLRHAPDRAKAQFETPVELPTQTEIPYPIPAVWDWDGDGEKDLLVASSYGYVYLFDRDFITHGYAQAQVISAGDSLETKGK